MDRLAHIVVAEGWSGLTDAEQVAGPLANRVFECGHCSDAMTRVYHNVIGQHRHMPAEALRDGYEFI